MASKEWYNKNREKMRAYRKKWYEANREKQKALVVARKQRLAEWVTELKESLACEICGEDHVATLDFHHDDPNEKEMGIADAIYKYGWSKKRILAEIAKCRVYCSNCHRKHHWSG